MLTLGLASYLSLYPALLLPPLILLSFDAKYKSEKSVPSILFFALSNTSAFLGSIACFMSESFLLTGSWEFISSTYGVHLLLPDLTPNVGLWWYFFIEMFDSFREFFLGVFWLHLGSYVGGLCIRLRTQPLFVITTLLGLCAIFKPYPSISDTALYLSLLPCYRHIFPRKLPINIYLDGILTDDSNEIYVLLNGDAALCILTGTGVLLSVDLRRVWQRQLLLRNNPGLESGTVRDRLGFFVCSAAR